MIFPSYASTHYPELSQYHDLLHSTSNRKSVHVVKLLKHRKVDRPLESYIMFTINYTDGLESHLVERRYSDFDWLIKALEFSYPFHILPPIPPKRVISMIDKFSRQFIDKRMDALQIMMSRFCDIEECMVDERMRVFLTYNYMDFLNYRKCHKNHSVFQLFRLYVKDVYKDTVIAFASSDTFKMDDSTAACINLLNSRIAYKTILSTIVQSVDVISHCWNNYIACLYDLGIGLADIVLIIEENDAAIMTDNAAQFFFNLSEESRKHCKSIVENMKPALLEYEAYTANIIRIIRHRNTSKNDLDIKSKEMRLIESQSMNDSNTLTKGCRLDQLSRQSIIIEDRLDNFNKIFFAQYSVWQLQKSHDIALCINEFLISQIRFHRSCLDMAKSLLDKINEC